MAQLKKRQAERIAQTDVELARFDALRCQKEKENGEFRRRTEQNLAEIMDKLNGLIGYIEGRRPG